MSGFKNFIMHRNPIAARRCPACTAQITPGIEQPRTAA
jgi:hypothetical protein